MLLALASVVWIVVAAATLVLSGTAGKERGWAWCVLALLPLAALAWAAARRARHRVGLILGAAVVSVGLGLGVAWLAPPSIERVDRVSASIPVPSDAHLVSVTGTPNDWCLQGCSHVERLYTVPDAAAALAALKLSLKTEGWQAVSDRWCRSGYSVDAVKVPDGDPRLAQQRPPTRGSAAIAVVTTAGC